MVLVTQCIFFLLMNLLWHLFLKMKTYYIIRNTLRVQNLHSSEMWLRSELLTFHWQAEAPRLDPV